MQVPISGEGLGRMGKSTVAEEQEDRDLDYELIPRSGTGIKVETVHMECMFSSSARLNMRLYLEPLKYDISIHMKLYNRSPT